MGGERQDYVSKTETQGSVTGMAGKLRFHESAGQVHFHDDALGLKAAIPVAEWWKAWEKLKVGPFHWVWSDAAHDTILTVETILTGEPPGIEANLSLARGIFGSNFKALNAFTKRK